jgi:hypothetical protein
MTAEAKRSESLRGLFLYESAVERAGCRARRYWSPIRQPDTRMMTLVWRSEKKEKTDAGAHPRSHGSS